MTQQYNSISFVYNNLGNIKLFSLLLLTVTLLQSILVSKLI